MRISDPVLDVLSNRLTYSGNSVAIEGQLERKLYVDVNKVLEACGLEWSRKAKRHTGDHANPAELIALAIATGEIVTAKDLGFFRTPSDLAAQLVAMAEIKGGQHVLEPSAGDGAIVSHIIGAGAYCHAIEYDATRYQALANGRVRIHDWASALSLDQMDFLDFEPEDPFDACVMNPPFLKVGKGDHIDHFYHALECLRPDGIAVSVMPSSVTFRTDRRHTEFRTRMQKFGTITPLPEGSFKASGTGVNTCVVKVRR